METRKGKQTKERTLALLGKSIAKGETTAVDIIRNGTLDESAVAVEYFYVLRGIQFGVTNKLPPAIDPNDPRP